MSQSTPVIAVFTPDLIQGWAVHLYKRYDKSFHPVTPTIMATVNLYLNFNGNTEDAFNFYRRVFGGEFTAFQRMKDTPDADKLSANDREKIMHVALPIGPGILLMGTDIPESMEKVTFGTNFSISVDAESYDEATSLFNQLSAGGTATMPLQKMFWGDYFGMLTDQFGIQWMIVYNDNQPQPAIEKATSINHLN